MKVKIEKHYRDLSENIVLNDFFEIILDLEFSLKKFDY